MYQKIKTQLNISTFKIQIFFFVLSFLGFLLIPKLPARLTPNKSLSSISINYGLVNASSYALEKEVTSILEGGLSTIEGVIKISSKSSKNNGSILLEFDKHKELNIARFEVSTVIRQLYKRLPEGLSYPIIKVNKSLEETNQNAFLSYSINAYQTPFEIHEIIKTQIEPKLRNFEGVDQIKIFGARPKEYVINYDLSKLKQLLISQQDIIKAIQQRYRKKSLGGIFHKEEYLQLTIGSNEEVNWKIPVKKINGRIIFLNDLATIKELEQETQSYFRVNGKNAITLSIYAKKNTNTIVLAKEITKRIEVIKKQLSSNYSIIETYNAANYLIKEINRIYERTIYTIVILLLFILFISRSIKYLWITFISLTCNLGIAFLLYFLLGVEIQLYSLAGITISLGLIIDNTIVMIDHIRKQNDTSVFISILASTLTTIGVLSMIYFLDDEQKMNLIDFAMVIIINLGISLFTTLFLVPVLLKRDSFRNKKQKKSTLLIQTRFYIFYDRLINLLLPFKRVMIIIIIMLFGIPLFMLPKKLNSNNHPFLEKSYNATFGNYWYRSYIRPYTDKYLGGSFRLFHHYVFENAYYSKNEEVKLYIKASMEKGATVHQMNQAFLEIEDYLGQFSEIRQYTSAVHSSDYALIEINFEDKFIDSSFPFSLKNLLIRKVLDLGGIDWSIYGIGNGFSNGNSINVANDFTIEVKGYNYDELNDWADTLKLALKKNPRVQKLIIKDNSYWSKKQPEEYIFTLDKEKLALRNSNSSKIFEELKSLTINNNPDFFLYNKGKYSPVRLESNNSRKNDLWSINNTQIDSINNPFMLKNIAVIYKKLEEENIYKENQEYIRLIQYQYFGSKKKGSKFLKEKLNDIKQKLPIGYQFTDSQNHWLLNSSKNNNYILLLFLVLIITYFICSVLFENLKQPFIVLSVVPISFIGVFLTFYWFNFNFDQGGLVSFVLLGGITVNASIFIINDFNKLKKELHYEKDIDIYIKAFKQKISPITLTIASTILGFIPFIKDGQDETFWFALGVGTIGGLFFSLLGIIIYLPLFLLRKNN